MENRIYNGCFATAEGDETGLSATKTGRFAQVLFVGAIALLMAFGLSACASSSDSGDSSADESSSASAEPEGEAAESEETDADEAENFAVSFPYSVDDITNAALAALQDKFESRQADFSGAGIDMNATEVCVESVSAGKNDSSIPIYTVKLGVRFWDADGSRVFLYQDDNGVFKTTPYLTDSKTYQVIEGETKHGDANEGVNVNEATVEFKQDDVKAVDYSHGKLTLVVPILSGSQTGCSSMDSHWAMPASLKGIEPAVTQALKEVLLGASDVSFKSDAKLTFESYGADPNQSTGEISRFNAVDADSEGNKLVNGYELKIDVSYKDSSGYPATRAGRTSFDVFITIAKDGAVTVEEVIQC